MATDRHSSRADRLRAPHERRQDWTLKWAKAVLARSWFWGYVLALATWFLSVTRVQTSAGLDASWQAALSMDAIHGVQFGTRAVFTYGPLGFIVTHRVFYPRLAVFQMAFCGTMAAAVYGVLIYSVRRFASLPTAVLVALMVGAPMVVIWNGPEAFSVVGAFVLLRILSGDRQAGAGDPRALAGDAWWAALGVMAGVNVLIKPSVGVGLVVLCAIALVAAPAGTGRRPRVVMSISVVATFLIGWLGTGNGAANVVPYFKGVLSESGGYSAAMYAVHDPLTYDNWWMVGLATVTVAASLLVFHPPLPVPQSAPANDLNGEAEPTTGFHERWSRLLPPLGVASTLALTMWVLFKEVAVRQGPLLYFSAIPILLAALFVRDPARLVTKPARTGRIAVLVATSLVAYMSAGYIPSELTDPVSDATHFVQLAHAVFFHDAAEHRTAVVRAHLQSQYALPPSMIALTDGKTVDIDPWEQQVAWAYPTMRLDALPVMEDYSAYTSYLDDLDAEFLATNSAPSYIIRQARDIDSRLQTFDPPDTQLQIECRYVQISATPEWQLLQRTADRCGQPQPLGVVHSGYGQTITVPSGPPDDEVVATFSLPVSISWHLLNFFYKPPGFNIHLNSGTAYRFIYGTESGMHVLLGASSLGYSSPYMPPAVRTLSISEVAHGPTGSGVTVTFYAIPMT